jgi:hypothetical protein
MIFIFLAFISGMKFNSMFRKIVIPVENVDVSKYETDFSDVSRLLSQNTLAVYGIADAVTNSWIKSLALGQDSANQIDQVFSKLENNGAKEVLTEKNKKIEDGMRTLKTYPFKYREAYKVLEEVYEQYCQFYKFTLNPAVSLIVYSKKISELEGELARSFSRLNLYAPKVAQHSGDVQVISLAMALPAAAENINDNGEVHNLAPVKIEGILGRTLEDVEKVMGAPQSETRAQTTGDYQREYDYNGQKVKVYYQNNLVAGFSN